MALETGTYISDLVSTNPTVSDNISQGDDHIRLLKATIKATFPNITGAVNPTQADLNKLTSSGSPQFSTIELGAASDTTISRSSAGVIAVEGVTVPLNSTTSTHTAQQIELGHASDTTISRVSAGLIAVEGGNVPLENRANTFTANQIISVTDNTNAALRITQLGTGNALLVEDSANPDSTPVVIDANGLLMVGTTSPTNLYSGSNSYTGNTFSSAGFDVLTLASTASSPTLAFSQPNSTSARFKYAAIRGVMTNSTAGSEAGVLTFMTSTGSADSAERMRIDASGNVLVTGSGGLGYGTGSGGTVTQATSKTTAVTLNKTNGKITMHNAALAAGASVLFSVSNTTVAATDTVIVNGVWGAVYGGNYRIEVANVYTSTFDVRITNITGGSRSEAVELNFSVIKAVTA